MHFDKILAHFAKASAPNPIVEVPFGNCLDVSDCKQAVFVAFIARDITPYANYDPAKKDPAYTSSGILMNYRADHMLGFPGGMMETGETLQGAVIREVQEELNYTIDKNRLIPSSTHVLPFALGGYLASHLYTVEANSDELKLIQKNALDAPHMHSENLGCIILRPETPRPNRGLELSLTNAMAASVREKIDVLLSRSELVSNDYLETIRTKTNYQQPPQIS